MSSSAGIAYQHDRTAAQGPKRTLTMHQPDPGTFDLFNPNLGWIVGPLALGTAWIEANLAHVDLSWAELLYSVAAVMYASAALIRTLREPKPSKVCRKSSSTLADSEAEDTVDLK